MGTGPLVTVCITNHNYGRFLGEAIESVLGQTYPHVEAIVVDDGSTDDSLEVARRYGDRIRLIAQANGGQCAANNAGYAAASGEIVAFLDADDLLEPDTVERVVAAFEANPDAVDVQYLVQVVDDAGVPMGGTSPRTVDLLGHGDLRPVVARYRSYPAQVGGGHAFRREAIAPAFPIPPDYRVAADGYLNEIVPLLGPIAVLDHVGYRYRMHGTNDSLAADAGLGGLYFRKKIGEIVKTHPHVRRVAAEVGVEGVGDDVRDALDPAFLGYRLASLRLEPAEHPIAGDRRLALAARGVLASLRHPLLNARSRVVRVVWFVLVGLLPAAQARRVIERLTPDVPRSTRRHHRARPSPASSAPAP